ncbi:glycosyl hydrolase family 28-related protein [Hansschlegelia beijingensis]|uniref:glycosyl hydrolase family 28-related protein n=1 Tax=Hansschlegelia beijingensis TaxID=1133344 RepID=UPI00387F3761
MVATDSAGGAIGEGLRSAAPGEIVTLAGAFTPGRTSFEVFGQSNAGDAVATSVAPLRISDSTAAIMLPATLPAPSVYLIWPKTDGRRGAPFAVNQTEAWWAGPSRVASGQRFAIYGRNLGGGSEDPHVYLTGPGRAGEWLPIRGADAYRIELDAPSRPAGDYALWVHNGAGGGFGWSGPLRLTLGYAPPAFGAAVFDVRRFGAFGDGVRDDGPAIEEAVAAAAARAPATVYFPSGVYASRRPFVAPPGVRWLGDGADRSVLRLIAPLTAPGFLYGIGDRSDVALERLAVEADGRIAGQDRALVVLTGERLSFSHVRLSSWGAMTLKLAGTEIRIAESEIIGAGSFLPAASQLFATDTTFRMTNDGEAALAVWSGRGIAMIGNRLVNADENKPDGHGMGRLFVAQPHLGGSRDMYFRDNETVNAAPRDCAAVDCNKGEQILFEFGSVRLQGGASRVRPTEASFMGELPEDAVGKTLIVAGGPGVGQRRRIVAREGGALKLDRPWDVLPDPSKSLFYVAHVAERAVVDHNRFQGRPTHSQHDSDSTAVLIFGLCFDMVVAANDIARMRHGVMVAATSGTPDDSVSAPFFALIERNRIRDGSNGIYTGLIFGYPSDPKVAGGVGNVFRNNEIAGMSHIGLAFDTWDTPGGDFHATVFERNRLVDTPFGVASGLKLVWTDRDFQPTPPGGTQLRQTILHANRIQRGSAPEAGSVGFRTDDFQDWLEIANEWRGFEKERVPTPSR